MISGPIHQRVDTGPPPVSCQLGRAVVVVGGRVVVVGGCVVVVVVVVTVVVVVVVPLEGSVHIGVPSSLDEPASASAV